VIQDMLSHEMGVAPRCKGHRLHILECLSCCVDIFEGAGLLGVDERHGWALINVYLPIGEW
jgi:hypothetical protein